MSPEITALVLSIIMVHLFVDWFLQTDWQATNKMKWETYCLHAKTHCAGDGARHLRYPHPASLVHAGLHLVFTAAAIHLMGFSVANVVWSSGVIASTHWFIDRRWILARWRETFRQTTDPTSPVAMHVAIWQDQVAHLLVIVAVGFVVAS